jgi:hypothetical protein
MDGDAFVRSASAFLLTELPDMTEEELRKQAVMHWEIQNGREVDPDSDEQCFERIIDATATCELGQPRRPILAAPHEIDNAHACPATTGACSRLRLLYNDLSQHQSSAPRPAWVQAIRQLIFLKNPHADKQLVAGDHQPRLIRAQGHVPGWVVGLADGEQLLAGLHVPDFY